MTTPHLRFVCTGKGMHPSRELGVLGVPDESPPGPVNPDDFIDPDDAKSLVSVPNTGIRYRFRRNRRGEKIDQQSIRFNLMSDGPVRFTCPSCGRDVPMTRRNVRQLILASVAAGLKKFDISSVQVVPSDR